MRTLTRRAGLAAVAAATLALASGPAAAQDAVRIGVIANLTGSSVKPNLDLTRGAIQAMRDINEGGGIDGAPIELIVEDSENRVQEALNAATKLYDVDGVQAVVMFGGSNLMLPVAELAQDKGRVLINNSSSSPRLGDFPGTLFSVLPLDNIVGKELGQWVHDRGVRRVAFVVPNNAFGTGLMNAAADAFVAAGGEVVIRTAYTEGQPDYRAEAQAVIQARPDAIVTAGYGDDSRKWFRIARALGLEVPWYAAYPSILSLEDPDWTSGRLFGVDNGGLGKPHVQDVLAAYREEYGEDTLSHFLYAYDAVTLLALAMREAGTEAAGIAAALPQVVQGYEGMTGQIVWDERGQRIDPPLDLIAYVDGAFTILD